MNHVGNLTRERQLFAPVTFSVKPLQSYVCRRPKPPVVRERNAPSSGLSKFPADRAVADELAAWELAPAQIILRKRLGFP